MMDWWNETAKRCHDMPEGWRWFSLNAYDAPDGFVQVKGSVPIGTYKSGPRKGRPKWGPVKDSDTIWMKQSHIDETKRRWAIKTGKCAECQGAGKVVKSISVTDGTTYRPCQACKASGKCGETTIDEVLT